MMTLALFLEMMPGEALRKCLFPGKVLFAVDPMGHNCLSLFITD